LYSYKNKEASGKTFAICEKRSAGLDYRKWHAMRQARRLRHLTLFCIDNLYSPSNGSRKKNNNNNNDKNNIEIKNNKYKHAQNCATTRKLHLLLA